LLGMIPMTIHLLVVLAMTLWKAMDLMILFSEMLGMIRFRVVVLQMVVLVMT